MSHERLKEELIYLQNRLLCMGQFNEAHCLAVAVESPSLCHGEYFRFNLQETAGVAVKYELFEVATWITIILGAVSDDIPAIESLGAECA